ncbi:hypothetical protein Tco_1504495 [Tanacetum coccineum]
MDQQVVSELNEETLRKKNQNRSVKKPLPISIYSMAIEDEFHEDNPTTTHHHHQLQPTQQALTLCTTIKLPIPEERVFESDIKGSTASSSSTQNVAFVIIQKVTKVLIWIGLDQVEDEQENFAFEGLQANSAQTYSEQEQSYLREGCQANLSTVKLPLETEEIGMQMDFPTRSSIYYSSTVLDLQKVKDAQAAEILKLKTRIKKLEKKGEENAKPGPTFDAFNDLNADLAHGMDYMKTEEAMNEGRKSNETEELNLDVDTEVIVKDKGSGEKGGSTVSTARPEVHTANAPVSTAGVTISTADPEVSVVKPRTPPTITSIFDDEDITMAQTLIKMKEEKAKEKGVAFKDIKRKDQGIDQIERDEELAHKLHEEELAEIARIQEKKAAQEEASRVAIMEMFDEVQACIDVDALFAAKLQQEEREEYTIEERAKFLADTIALQRKFKAAQRVAEIRSRPPTKSQLRNLMMAYLKNMGDYKHSQLKAKTFKEIQAMYERQKKKINDFKPMDSDDAVKDSKKAAGEDTSKKEKVLKEPDSTKIESMNKEDAGERVSDVLKKRKGGPRMKRMSKRKKTESDLEEEEDIKTFMKIVSDKEGMIDYDVLKKRFPIINWESKFNHYDRHGAVSTTGSLDMMEALDGLRPFLKWWQERWNLKSWNFYENCKVHTLTLEDGTEIHMLVERKYLLTKETLEWMMSLKLIPEFASDSAYYLLRFIQKQIDEAGSHDGGEKDL